MGTLFGAEVLIGQAAVGAELLIVGHIDGFISFGQVLRYIPPVAFMAGFSAAPVCFLTLPF